jgi:CubicO group peptidase (beta-lactamase class C family)
VTSPHPLTLVVAPDSPLDKKVVARIAKVLLTSLRESFPASFNLGVFSSSETLLRAWGGVATYQDDGDVDATHSTIYDLASLTKVVATTTLVLWLSEQSKWKISDSVSKWVPGFARDDVTLEHLLTHTSGLIPHIPFFSLYDSPRAIRRAVLEESRNGVAGEHVAYSDLNFMLLGWAIQNCTRTSLDRLFTEVVAAPLGLRTLRFRPSWKQRPSIAATELNGDQRRSEQLVWGDVHDGNAWALGGVAGHAGLFSSADDLGVFAQALLDPQSHRLLSSASITAMSTRHAGRHTDVRGLGWKLKPRELGRWPDGTFWHTGFTGTSLLVDPIDDLAVVLLCNAVHPFRQLERQAAFRSAVHKALLDVKS